MSISYTGWMPKNSSLTVLRRWKAMDYQLRYGRLLVHYFARKNHVVAKTVRRDLDAFRILGQKLIQRYDLETREYYWVYRAGTQCLFVGNLEP